MNELKVRRAKRVTDSDSVAVVGDLDEFKAAVFDEEGDGGGGGVEAVLEELFDGGDGALDDLAGGYTVNDGVAETLDFGRIHSGQGLELQHLAALNLNLLFFHWILCCYVDSVLPLPSTITTTFQFARL